MHRPVVNYWRKHVINIKSTRAPDKGFGKSQNFHRDIDKKNTMQGIENITTCFELLGVTVSRVLPLAVKRAKHLTVRYKNRTILTPSRNKKVSHESTNFKISVLSYCSSKLY